MELVLLICIGLFLVLAPGPSSATVHIIADSAPKYGWRLTMILIFAVIALLVVVSVP